MFRVLRSSAGAGKTHALVKHYLVLALADDRPDAYTRILALTFTNKAAREMRERILHYLDGLASEEAPNAQIDDVRDAVIRASGAEAPRVKARAAAMHSHVLHHWPRFAVSTIDAFTRRVVMPFARDLRLDSELRMTTEEAYFRDLAVDRLLERAGSDEALTRTLTAICEDLLEDERAHRPDAPLRQLARELTKEQALVHLVALRDLEHQRFLEVRDTLRTDVRAFRERIRKPARAALEAVATEGLAAHDFYQTNSGPYGYLKKVGQFNEWLDPNAHVRKALLENKWASGKADVPTRDAVERVAPFLREALQQLEEARENGALARHAIACAILRDLLPSAALHLLDEQLEIIKREEGLTFFSDLVRKVALIVQNEPAPFLYERLGDRYDHFLVDEFQDTSILQWQAMLPLITNALSGTGSALLVGDAKQAIYRWRNGEARQFTGLPFLFGKELMSTGAEHEAILRRTHRPIEQLEKNHRSARNVIRMNNELFDALREELPEPFRVVYAEQAQLPVREVEGHITLCCYAAPAKQEQGEEQPPDQATVFTVESVRNAVDRGFRPGDIAVLVRTKKQGRMAAEALTAVGYQVVSPDGLDLGSDPAVMAIISLFRWRHQPDDATAAHAAQALHALRGAEFPWDTAPSIHALLDNWTLNHALPAKSDPVLQQLHGLADALLLDPVQDAFVMGLLDEAHGFIGQHGDDPSGWLEHWDRVGRKRAVGGTQSAGTIRVMTIHASKGLQFPVVVVPWADMRTRAQADRVWIDPRAVTDALPATLVKQRKPLTGLGIPEMEAEAQLNEVDLMDLLYVAFTRAEERLYAGVDGAAKSGLAVHLRKHFGLEPGTTKTIGEDVPTTTPPKRIASDGRALPPTLGAGRALLVVRSEAPAEWDPTEPDPYRSAGNLIHAILARVRTINDLDEAMRVELGAAVMATAEQQELRAALSDLLERHELAPFFRPGLDVRTEAAIIDPSGLTLRPDRVVSDGNVTRVLDIKTGKERQEHHEQVSGYSRVLRDLTGTPVTGHLLYIPENRATHVRLVDVTY